MALVAAGIRSAGWHTVVGLRKLLSSLLTKTELLDSTLSGACNSTTSSATPIAISPVSQYGRLDGLALGVRIFRGLASRLLSTTAAASAAYEGGPAHA